MTPQNPNTPTRVRVASPRLGRMARIGLAGVAVVTASVTIPAFAQARDGDEAVAVLDLDTSTSINAEISGTPSTSSTSTTSTAPVVVEPTPDEAFRAKWATATPEERAWFELVAMSDAGKQAFAAYITPPPPPPPAPVVEELVEEPAPEPSYVEPPPVANGEIWDRLVQCEATGDWHINSGNGYSGGLQFHPTTWLSSGGGVYAPQAYLATREQQIAIAEVVLAAAGGRFTPWPGCRAKLGLP